PGYLLLFGRLRLEWTKVTALRGVHGSLEHPGKPAVWDGQVVGFLCIPHGYMRGHDQSPENPEAIPALLVRQPPTPCVRYLISAGAHSKAPSKSNSTPTSSKICKSSPVRTLRASSTASATGTNSG